MKVRKPKQGLVIGTVDVFDEFSALMTDDFELGVPAPKTYTVEVPGGDDIDLTDALSGDCAYSDRAQEFELVFLGDEPMADYRRFKNRFHGRAFDYVLSGIDPGATYHGRFSVESKERGRGRVVARVSVDASPWRLIEHVSRDVGAGGGVWLTLSCGRRPVRPVWKLARATEVTMGGVAAVASGTVQFANVLLTEGDNLVYVNSSYGVAGDRPLSELGTTKACGDATISDLSWKTKPTDSKYEINVSYDRKEL